MDTSQLFRVDGMVAVVTGGGTGIGLVMARALAGAGAHRVYILGRRRERLEAAAAATPGLVPLACDVTSKASLQAAVDAIARDAGRVNLLVANSGVTGPTAQRFAPGLPVAELRRRLFVEVEPRDFAAAFEVNVAGAYFTMLAFLELLDAGNRHALGASPPPPAGSADAPPPVFGAPDVPGAPVPAIQSQVLFTSSIAAYSRMAASAPAYAGSKAAIAQLAKHASSNLASYGIRVNALAPGLFPTELAAGMIASRDPAQEGPENPMFIPARRWGGDEEMAGTVLYLASRAGAYCNGSIVPMDGGRMSVMPASY